MLPAVNRDNEIVGILSVNPTRCENTVSVAAYIPSEDDGDHYSTVEYIKVPLDLLNYCITDMMGYFHDEEHIRSSLTDRLMNQLPSRVREVLPGLKAKLDFVNSPDKRAVTAQLQIPVAKLTDEMLELVFDTPTYEPV